MTTNEKLFDASIRHQIFLIRFGGSLAREVLGILDEAQADLERRLAGRLARLGPISGQVVGKGQATSRRIEAMVKSIREQSRDIRAALEAVVAKELRGLVDTEVDLADRRLTEAVGVDMGNFRPSPEVLRTLATDPEIRGRSLRKWFKKLTDDRTAQLEAAIRLGIVEGDTTPQIIRRFRAASGVNRRNAEALAVASMCAIKSTARCSHLADRPARGSAP